MSLGSGYRYLMESTAGGDGAAGHASALTRYYADSGTPPGRFLGAGLDALDGGNGVPAGAAVGEEALWAMLGNLADPVTGEPLGRAPNKQPMPLQARIAERVGRLDRSLSAAERHAAAVEIDAAERARQRNLKPPVAGFDLTFSVPKSVSAAWALADEGTKAVIYAAHQEAIARTIAYAEAIVFHSRSGTNGVVQESVRGVIAAGFDHWDSRASDPHLHTHVVVLNRAQTADGTWRTLDSRGLFKHVVELSELHEGILSDVLTESLGWGWDARARRHSDAPRWEVAGVGDALVAEFSQRATQIEAATDALVARHADALGRRPTGAELMRLRQQATLSTRADKHHHSLAELSQDWRERARRHVGGDPVAWVETLRGRNDLPPLRSGDLSDDMLRGDAANAVARVAEKRATFSRANVAAEVHRMLHGVRFASSDERIAVAERTVDHALAGAMLISAPELHHTPARFRRGDGTSRFRGRGAEIYTTRDMLDAEDRLLGRGRDTGGPALAPQAVAAMLEANLPGKDYGLSVDQAAAVAAIATSGRALDVLVGPAGTGKSTSMAGLRMAWEAQHGPGSVVGLAPSAAAAEVLGDELGIDTENTAKWLTEARQEAERVARIAELRRQRADRAASPRAYRQLTQQIDALTATVERWRIRPGQLVIVDEASLAGTFALDELTAAAARGGGKVLLVGDWAQLSAVEAGGAFAMLVRDRELAPELTDVRRFSAAWEKAASVELRVGRGDAIDAYVEHGRVEGGDREEMVEALYGAWRQDVRAGKTSLMIAGDLATVTELNARARADRIAAGDVDPSREARIAEDGRAGVGDRIVTRSNNRLLITGPGRWVKNGDSWTVEALNDDGSMEVRRAGGAGRVVLPADYVREHVELAYASTAHRAQGKTVDTAHAFVSPTTSREVLYVMLTRGRDGNRVYVDTAYDPDRDTAHDAAPAAALAEPADVLRAVAGSVGADLSAHQAIDSELDAAESWVTLAAQYQTIAREAQAERYDAIVQDSGLTAGELAEVRESPAYGPLLSAMREADARGLDIAAALPALVQGRTLAGAEDVGSVLHGRVDRWLEASGGRRVPADRFIAGLIPAAADVQDDDMRRALAERAETMERRARDLAERAIARAEPWAAQLGPAPADPLEREAWLRDVTTVAAYRDRWAVSGRAVLPAGDVGSIERLGHHKRAQAAADRAAAQARAARAAQPAATAWDAGAASDFTEGPTL
jgi:conjugative relaxase-like TrwC/TraI family protein